MAMCIIEKVSIKDAKELLDIYAPYVLETAISFEIEVPSLEEFENRITQISSKYPYLKAIVDGEIVGYAYASSFKGRKAYDWSVETTVYIKKDCRRMGIGKMLYEQLEISLQSMGILNMNACIACPSKPDEFLTDDSERFHCAMGFTLVGKFHNSGHKFNSWYDMIWMEKMIGVHEEIPKAVLFGEYE